jgi:KaiC/GvpD/RAD55 family RecA-like ATPase
VESAKHDRDPEKQARFYSMAEKVLGVAAEYFIKAGYQDKTNQVQRLLRKVKDERALALSLGEIFHAPTITSSTATFSTLSPGEEIAVGLERFDQADIQTKIVQHETDIKVGGNVAVEIQMVNVGKEPVSLIRINDIVPTGFQLVDKPDYCILEDKHLIVKGKRLTPLKTEEIKISLRAYKTGSIEVNPKVISVDWAGHQISSNPEPVAFNVSSVALPGRVSTGYADLDNLLLGGIPENYAVVLASPSNDVQELLIKKFLEAATKEVETTFYVTAEPENGRLLAEEFKSSFCLFVCNPIADVMLRNLPNIFKLKGVENLTDINIALTKAFRELDTTRVGTRRACIEIVSDVLLQHHAVTTRKWLSELLPDLRARGFTTLAIVNPQMHPPEEVKAILGLFEGEINMSEKETEKGIEKTLRVRRLYNQRYLDNELILTANRLE